MPLRCRLTLLLLAVGLLLGAHGALSDPGRDQPAVFAAPAPGPEWTTLRGRIVWRGADVPKPGVMNVTRDRAACAPDGKMVLEDWVTDPKNQGVRWVHVWLEPDPDGKTKT